MDDQKQLIDKLQSAANILVTVSSNPSVDQLAACIGLTLALNKLDKHATAVFSGDIPDTIEFLKPEETLEKTTDSLRDFIIALDKAKADKLRYKVEDRVVKIFITPYRTSISSDDLDFSQGDFNVDLVVALGVHEQADLDQAITAHGRILHDATVVSINHTDSSSLGSINWHDTTASSLSELVTDLLKQLGKKLLDEQISTALLTGIVASTDRFRNEQTTAKTMSLSADLMAAGANQQLVTSQLEHRIDLQAGEQSDAALPESTTDAAESAPKKKSNDGTLEIDHEHAPAAVSETAFDESKFQEPELPAPVEPATETPPENEPAAQDEAEPPKAEPTPEASPADSSAPDIQRQAMKEPPSFGGPLTANEKSESESYEPSMDPLSTPTEPSPLLSHDKPADQSATGITMPTADLSPANLDVPPAHVSLPPTPAPAPVMPPEAQPQTPPVFTAPDVPPPPAASVPAPTEPHPEPSIDVDAARNEVMRALSEQPNETLPPIAALNAQPLGDSLHEPAPAAAEPLQPPTPPSPPAPAGVQSPLPPVAVGPDVSSPADRPLDMPLPPSSGLTVPPPQVVPPTNAQTRDPNAPPPVPPPMLPPNWPPKQ